MSAEIIRPSFGARPRDTADSPILRTIDALSFETENMAWLRKAAPIAKRFNEESRFDGGDDEAA